MLSPSHILRFICVILLAQYAECSCSLNGFLQLPVTSSLSTPQACALPILTQTKSHTQTPTTHRPSRTPRHQQHTDQVSHPDISNTQTKSHTQTPATHTITASRLTWQLAERHGVRLPAGARLFSVDRNV